jgi:hypothetical protein
MSLDKFGRSSHRHRDFNERHTPHAIGFSFTPDGNIDLRNLRICNVSSPLEDNDVVNKKTLSEIVNDEMLKLHKEIIKVFEIN